MCENFNCMQHNVLSFKIGLNPKWLFFLCGKIDESIFFYASSELDDSTRMSTRIFRLLLELHLQLI